MQNAITSIMRCMATVIVTPEARAEFNQLPLPIQKRVLAVFKRLEAWPDVSGAKPLRGKLAGNYRIRTGDYRIIFFYTKTRDTVTVWKIGYRGDIYD
jgi:mRNA interferase RelE/StbE